MKKVPRSNFDAFQWLPIERWTVDNLMGPKLRDSAYCKICDQYIQMPEASRHIARHVETRNSQIKSDKKKAQRERAIRLKLAREAKKQMAEKS